MPTPLLAPPTLRPLAELRRWLLASRARYLGLRLWLPYARSGVTLAISADCIKESNTCAALAHAAETSDREALALLDGVLADGLVTPAELGTLRRVRAHVARSAEQDHDLAERTTLPAA